MQETCPKCGQQYAIGSWPFCPHETVSPENHHFTPYKDIGLGQSFNTRGERREAMKKGKWDWASTQVGMPGCEV